QRFDGVSNFASLVEELGRSVNAPIFGGVLPPPQDVQQALVEMDLSDQATLVEAAQAYKAKIRRVHPDRLVNQSWQQQEEG
ncbi:unnamed protein product, partial [Discosporangium mesarthrocarpum]